MININRIIRYNEITPYEKGFNDYYQKEVLPEQQKLETRRGKYLKWFIASCIVGLLITLAIVVWNVLNWQWVTDSWKEEDGFENWASVIFIIEGGVGLLIFMPLKAYSKKIKSNIFCKTASFFADFNYAPEGKIKESNIGKSKILPRHNTYKGEDLLYGPVNDIGVQLSEAKLVSGSGKNRRTVFKGLFILFDLTGNREYNSRVVGVKDLGRFCNVFQRKWGMKRVSLEDPDLEKAFEFFADDQVEARIILDPAFMDRINDFYQFMRKTYKIKNIQFEFSDKKLFIMMKSNKNFFENYKVWESCIDTVYVRTFLREMHMIIKIADILQMERKARR